MIIHLMSDKNAFSEDFPMTAFEIEDALDRLGNLGENTNIRSIISKSENNNLLSEMCEGEFWGDIYKLNLLAERLVNFENAELAAFKSLLKTYPESHFDDMLLMTYGLDSMPVFACGNFYDLGELAIENDLLPELENCTEEISELLDREKIGRLVQERDGGIFSDGYYCVTSAYEKPDINFKFVRPESCFFRLLIASNGADNLPMEWLSLPCENEKIAKIENFKCLEFQSSLPQINGENLGNIGELNSLATRLAELSKDDFIKLKAVMEKENICKISETADCIDRLSEYEFDRNILDNSDFAKVYLQKNPEESAEMDLIDLYEFGSEILEQTGGLVTSYGAISARGQGLYPAQSEQEQTEDFCDEDESEDMEIGGMSL